MSLQHRQPVQWIKPGIQCRITGIHFQPPLLDGKTADNANHFFEHQPKWHRRFFLYTGSGDLLFHPLFFFCPSSFEIINLLKKKQPQPDFPFPFMVQFNPSNAPPADLSGWDARIQFDP